MKRQLMKCSSILLQWRKRLSCMALIVMIFALGTEAQEKIGKVSIPLTTDERVQLWTSAGNVVPVCWETAGYQREKRIVREAVEGTWEFYANIRFTGWVECATSGSAQHVRVSISPQDNTNLGAGGSALIGMAALGSPSDSAGRLLPKQPGVKLSFNPDGTADQGRVEYIAVHEFGHVLGFLHEQDAPGNEGPGFCNNSISDTAKPKPITGYDRDSIMNYCNRDNNIKGNLTDTDIAGVQATYGARVQNVASQNSCSSYLPRKQTASLAWAWNDGSNETSIAVYPSDKTKFLERSSWISRSGGWGDSVKWTEGDFDGDGRSDIAAAWNNGGTNTLTVRLSNGTTFNTVHWATNAGGWSDSTVWLPGNFNKDDRTDLAAVWNDGGQVSIAVYLSDGKKFLSHSQWSLRDGGWGDTVKWTAGDFNGDGLTDIASAWNNDGRITLTVRQSTGSAFIPVHWALDAGAWRDSSIFIAGDFDGDGDADLAKLWDDLSQNSIAVSLSDGVSFQNPADWGTRDGGWITGQNVKWTAGDFNGDGRTDIGAVWNDGNLNTLTVRQSTGSTFTPVHWANQAGGWRDSAAWCSGQFAPEPISAVGRVPSSETGPRQFRSICEFAQIARDRNSPAAAGLEEKCLVVKKGQALANADPLATELRNQQPDDAARQGFDIGMATAEGDTLPGPGKNKACDSLSTAAEQSGCHFAVLFSVDRNRNAALASTGAAIAAADAIVANARNADNDVFYRLGFDIATGLFGDPALGAKGNTEKGPGSLGIRDSLSPDGQRGFNASMELHLSRSYKR